MSMPAAPVELASDLDHRNNQVAETRYFTNIRPKPYRGYMTQVDKPEVKQRPELMEEN